MFLKEILLIFLYFSVSNTVPAARRLIHLDAVLKVPFKGVHGKKHHGTTIIWGQEVKRNSLPYHVALLVLTNGNVYFCSGSLISDLWVVTSARCVKGADSVDIVLGAHDVTSKEPGAAIFRSFDIIVHHWWTSSHLVNDIALIRLPHKVPLSDKIRPIILATDDPMEGETVVQSGWGKTGDVDGKGSYSDVLKKTEFRINSKSECEYHYWFLGTDKTLCTFGKEEGACNGDFGSPFTDIDNKILYGLTSFVAPGRCGPVDPGIFTSIFQHLDWIKHHTGISPLGPHHPKQDL